jgi:hypothetical protein
MDAIKAVRDSLVSRLSGVTATTETTRFLGDAIPVSSLPHISVQHETTERERAALGTANAVFFASEYQLTATVNAGASSADAVLSDFVQDIVQALAEDTALNVSGVNYLTHFVTGITYDFSNEGDNPTGKALLTCRVEYQTNLNF